jgi:glucuronoarabinoxylan endo-1,4-beta-xylanase
MKAEASRLKYFLIVGAFFAFLSLAPFAHAAVSVSVSPTSTSSVANATTTFVATVMNASNTAVTWSAIDGTISSSGVYTAPSVLGTSTVIDTITATSIQDNTKSATATITVSSGLAGFWNLDEGTGTVAYDRSGNGNNGTWSGSTPYYAGGKVGPYGGVFNGTNNAITASSVSPANITVSFWIKDPTPNLDYNGIIDAGKNQTSQDWYFIDENTSCGNGQGLRFSALSSGAELCYNWGDSGWHMVTGVYSAADSAEYLYIDGVLMSSANGTRKTPQSYPLDIGKSNGAPNYFTGDLDDVRIYNRSLSGAEIQGIYGAENGTGLTAPSAPTGVAAIAGDNEATVSFNRPSIIGGSAITVYTVTSNPGNFVATSSVATSTIVYGLSNGTSYTFTVTATNGIGTSSSSVASNGVTPAQGVVGINWSNVDQSIDGFGGSTAFESQPLTTSQADLFFSTSTGVGLSLLRTMVPDDGSCSTVNGTCAGEVADMQEAAARGVTVWSTPWSAPATMTSNGSVDCTTAPSPSHLTTSSYASYATYLSNYIASVKAQGISLYALSVQNEPDVCVGYDSLLWSDQTIHDFVKNNLGPTLAANSQTNVKIMLPESTVWSDFTGLADTTMNDPAASTYVGILAFHGYDNSFSIINPYAASGKSFWETETSGLIDGASSLTVCGGCWDPSMTDALIWAQVINYNLTGANVNAWNYWWLINQNNSDNEGLIDASGDVSKRLYMMGNYSKFVRPGWHRIDATINPTTGIYISAFKDPTNNQFAIVAINTNATGTSVALNLNNFPYVSSVTPWVTSASLNLSAQAPLAIGGDSFTPTLGADTVTTFVGSKGTAPTPLTVGVASGYAPSLIATNSSLGATSLMSGGTTTVSGVSNSSLLAELNSLESELSSLQSQANGQGSSYIFTRNLSYGMTGTDVAALQAFLIQENSGPAAQKLKVHGTTQTFASLTYSALVEFQKSVGITPASGFFGPITRAWVNGKE